MASPTPKPRKPAQQISHRSSVRPAETTAQPDPVNPVWLLKAFGLVVIAALICGYLSLCLLFYQGQWQLVLHPSRSRSGPVAIAGVPIQFVRFGVDESATPQLAGYWIPAQPLARYAGFTILYLSSGDGSLSSSVEDLAALHSLGVNLFAFDYRGYGQSAQENPDQPHPNQRRMAQDAASAWQYLTVSRAVPSRKVVVLGVGVGAFLAAQLAGAHAEVPALILDSPRPDLLDVVLADPRVQSLPVRTLFHERFDIGNAVASLKTPKLILVNDAFPGSEKVRPTLQQNQSLIDEAASPKIIAHLAVVDLHSSASAVLLSRFLGEYLH